MKNLFTEKLKYIPDKPGVYLMKDDKNCIIYVGKAIILKNRIRSYFQSDKNYSVKVKNMISKINDFEYIITTSEIEAIILECNLIKKYHPRYNISLRDDKNFPYIKISNNDNFPKIFMTRQVKNDGSTYFGPYTNVGAVHETLQLLKKFFPLRSCRQLDSHRPCLRFHLKNCLAPCAGKISSDNYKQMIKSICFLLEGRSDIIQKELKFKMEKAIKNLNFEIAATLHNQIVAIEKVVEKQNIITGRGDQDIIGIASSISEICVQIFFMRKGKMVGRENFFILGGDGEEPAEIILMFVKQYYNSTKFIPKEIIIPIDIEEKNLLVNWLSSLKGKKVTINIPKRGSKKNLINMASNNALITLNEQKNLKYMQDLNSVRALDELSGFLNLPKSSLNRIECFDVSHTYGTETVASMIVFENGQPLKKDYRRYKLQTIAGKPDDFKSIQEVVNRRYQNKKLFLPNLIIIDGGKGQLNSALPVIRQLGLINVPVIALAKKFEEIFCEGTNLALILPRTSQALYLVQKIRNEAHRFALTYHRKLRGKRNIHSVLDCIGGIGPKRRNAILEHFTTLDKIKTANITELKNIPFMTILAAEAVYNFFRNREKK